MDYPDGTEVRDGDRVSLVESVPHQPLHIATAVGVVLLRDANVDVDVCGHIVSVSPSNLKFLYRAPAIVEVDYES